MCLLAIEEVKIEKVIAYKEMILYGEGNILTSKYDLLSLYPMEIGVRYESQDLFETVRISTTYTPGFHAYRFLKDAETQYALHAIVAVLLENVYLKGIDSVYGKECWVAKYQTVLEVLQKSHRAYR